MKDMSPVAQCAAALDRCECNWIKVDIFLQEIDFKTKLAKDGSLPWAAAFSPAALSCNMMLPFFVSIMEDYFRSVYVALLAQSDKKLGLLKSRRLTPEDLLQVSEGTMTIEMAVSRTLSFQNIDAICRHFKDLDRRIHIKSALDGKRPRSKEVTSQVMARVINARHRFVHENAIDRRYTRAKARKDCQAIRLGITRVHEHLSTVYGWPETESRQRKPQRITRMLPEDAVIHTRK